MHTYTIPRCSELWTEQMARDHTAGIAVAESPCEGPFDLEKSLSKMKEAYIKAYTENPMLPRSRYLDPLSGKVLWQ